MKSREDWQVKQAKEAIQLFIYYTRCKSQTEAKTDPQSDTLWRAVAQDMITALRLKHRALSTTMIYTHVLNKGGQGVTSPSDSLKLN